MCNNQLKNVSRITNGIWSNYATMAVRTGGPGPSGISLLIVPLKGHPGVTMRRITTGGAACAGTTFIELDDVKVPVENLIAKVTYNFIRDLHMLTTARKEMA